ERFAVRQAIWRRKYIKVKAPICSAIFTASAWCCGRWPREVLTRPLLLSAGSMSRNTRCRGIPFEYLRRTVARVDAAGDGGPVARYPEVHSPAARGALRFLFRTPQGLGDSPSKARGAA